MDISVLIPSFGRSAKLARCLARLAHQTLAHDRFEVLIGLDGRAEHDTGDAQAVQALVGVTGSMRAVVHEFEHAGPGVTRNRLAEHAKGRWLVLLNDDVLPEPDLLEAHLQAQTRAAGPAMVLGAAPWVIHTTGQPAFDTLFDRLIRDTSMIFFYDRMHEMLRSGLVDVDHDWGFRHAWTLNLSLPRSVFESVGGFDPRLVNACYEDIEFAYRVWKSTGAPVRFAPAAVVHHDHRIAPEDYLRREQMLGRAAWAFASASPLSAMEVFGRDIRGAKEIDYSQAFVDRERGAADRLRRTMSELHATPSAAIDGPHAELLLRTLYEHHLLLKRWTWRCGLLEAAATG